MKLKVRTHNRAGRTDIHSDTPTRARALRLSPRRTVRFLRPGRVLTQAPALAPRRMRLAHYEVESAAHAVRARASRVSLRDA